MGQDTSFNTGLLRMAGISSMLGGVCILVFAVVAQSRGIFLVDGVYEGADIGPWLQNVRANPALSRIIMVLPAIGFSCMFVLMWVLREFIAEESWQKTLAVTSYSIGVPLSVVTFVLQLSLMNEVLLLGAQADTMPAFAIVASVQLYFFHVVNQILGPLFIIVLGTAMMAWAAMRAKALPRWICVWLMLCGVMVSLSFLAVLLPALKVLGLFAPLHMLGLVMLGVILLRR